MVLEILCAQTRAKQTVNQAHAAPSNGGDLGALRLRMQERAIKERAQDLQSNTHATVVRFKAAPSS